MSRLFQDVICHPEWQCLCGSGVSTGRKVEAQGFGRLQLSLELSVSLLLWDGPRAELPLSPLNVLEPTPEPDPAQAAASRVSFPLQPSLNLPCSLEPPVSPPMPPGQGHTGVWRAWPQSGLPRGTKG